MHYFRRSKLFGITVLMVILNGCATFSIDRVEEHVKKSLLDASVTQGVSIVSEGTTFVTQDGLTFAAASITGVDKIPPTQYSKGVDVGFAYLEFPGKLKTAGFFTLRVYADVREIGEVSGRMDFIDQQGRVAVKVAGTADVFSLTVPAVAPFQGNVITSSIFFDEKMELGAQLEVDSWCSNGLHWDSSEFPDDWEFALL